MSLRKKLAAAVLCLALLTGCAGLPAETAPASPDVTAALPYTTAAPTESTDYLSAGQYFGRVERPDVQFADMRARRWTEGSVDDAILELSLAAADGSEDAFRSACAVMDDMLDGIMTAYVLAELDSDAHAGDELRLHESSRLYNLYNRAVSGYDACLAVWNGEDGESEGSAGAAALELSERENELLSRYAVLSSGDGDDDALAELFVELVSVRNEMAELYGYDSYADYAYAELYSRAYVPEEAQKIWTAAREDVMPLYAEKYRGVYSAAENSFSLWRLDCSPERVRAALLYGAQHMSPEVSEACGYMLRHGLCDLERSDDKRPKGYTVWLPDYKVPYIFNAPSGLADDYQETFHEFGHFLSYFYCGGDGQDDFDLCEIQSQGMEMMFLNFYDDIFGDAAAVMRAEAVLGMLGSVIDGAMYDEFQQRVYAEKSLTPERADEIFAELYVDYGYAEYDGFERGWTWLGHNFENPFYYISYAVSALPALELFVRAQDSPAEAADAYLRIAAMSSEHCTVEDAFTQPGMTDWLNAPDAQKLISGIRSSGVLDV